MCSSGSRWVSRWRGVWRDGLEALWRLESVSQILYMLSCFSHVWLFATPWTVAHQAPLSMGIYRQEYWSGLPFPSPGDPLHPELNLGLLHCRQILYWLSYEGSPNYWYIWSYFCHLTLFFLFPEFPYGLSFFVFFWIFLKRSSYISGHLYDSLTDNKNSELKNDWFWCLS